jgi:hypothetical protein
MSSKSPSSTPPDPADSAVYVWARLDPRRNSLLSKKLSSATSAARLSIAKESKNIRLNNRFNRNATGVDLKILGMWEEKIDTLAAKQYEILLEYWSLLGQKKTGTPLRTCAAIVAKTIHQLGNTAGHAARMLRSQRNIGGRSLEGDYQAAAQRICARWKENIEIEASDLDLAASTQRTERNSTLTAQPEFAKQTDAPVPLLKTLGIPPPPEMVLKVVPRRSDEVTGEARARRDFVLPLLEEKGWSVLDWAKNSKVDVHSANGYLKGETRSYRSTRKKLAESLGLKARDLPG